MRGPCVSGLIRCRQVVHDLTGVHRALWTRKLSKLEHGCSQFYLVSVDQLRFADPRAVQKSPVSAIEIANAIAVFVGNDLAMLAGCRRINDDDISVFGTAKNDAIAE